MDDIDSTKVVVSSRRKSQTPLWRKLTPSIRSLSLIIIFFFSLFLNGDITPLTKRGFFCNDTSIKYPFKPDTVDMKILFLTSLIIPGIVIKICDTALRNMLRNLPKNAIVSRTSRKRRKVSDDEQEFEVEKEVLIANDETKRRHFTVNEDDSDYEAVPKDEEQIKDEDEDSEINLFSRIPLENHQETNIVRRIHPGMLERAFGEFQLFFFGFVTTMLFSGIGKITLGRLRPHFMQRCIPNVDCSSLENLNKYIEEFTCTNSQLRSRDMSYITTSWPSGHAAIIFYSMFYLAIYLNKTIPAMANLSKRKVISSNPLILYTMYVLMIGLAVYIASTRVSDYHHHPLDVFSGSVIGTLIAIGIPKSASVHRRQTP